MIRGNRIAAIGRKGGAPPPNAQVINADGKFIVPGLWDALDNFVWNQGELLLNNGVTSFIGIGDMGEVGVVYTEGANRGKIRGPRPFDWPVHFVGAGAAVPGGGNRTGRWTRVDRHRRRELCFAESLLRSPGRYAVVVRNAGVADPKKLGDGSSNRGWLIVGYR